MFNPAQFFAARQPASYSQSISRPQQKPIVIDQLHEYPLEQRSVPRTKWDQPLVLPSVLYAKFNVPLPQSQQQRQEKPYPLTLLDYIKRAYQRCKDEEARRNMERQLRKVIGNFEDDLNQVDWKTYPIPHLMLSVPQPKSASERQSRTQAATIRRGEIRLPNSYNIVDVEDEKPSKAKLMAQKRLEKLEQKLNNQDQPVQQQEEKKLFIGFQSKPDPPAPRFQAAPSIKPQAEAPRPKISFPPPPSFDQTKKKTQNELFSRGLRKKSERSSHSLSPRRKQEKTKKSKKQKPQKSKKHKQDQQRATEKEKKKSPVRINRKQLQLISKSKDENQRLGQVARRFAEFNKMKVLKFQKDVVNEDDELNIDETIVGKSQNIEKPYLRITGRPNPDTVRPEPVLKKALKFFLDKYKKGCDYEYLISQFKSIRQDLTVQHIKNALTVQVYQQNMRISLFEDDTAQFKHCQTTLWQLYCQGLFYSQKSREEYMSYQMITLIMQGKFQDMEFMLTQLPHGALSTPRIQDCLKLKRLLMVGNYRGFFDFVSSRDTFSRRLLNLYIDKVRVKCLLMVCKTFGEKISLKSLAELLGEDEDVLQAIINEEKGIVEQGYLILKPSYQNFLKSEHLITRKVTVTMG